MAAFSVRRLNDVWTGEFRWPGHEHWHFHLVLGGHFITNDNYNLRFIIVPRGRLRPSVMLTSVWLLVTICKQFEANYQCFNDSSFPLSWPGAAWSPMLMSCDIPDIPRTIQQYPVTTLRVMADADSVREKIGNYTAISLLLWENVLLSISVRHCVIESGITLILGEIASRQCTIVTVVTPWLW